MIKKITLLLFVVLATITTSYGQASGYSFTETTETYTAVTGTNSTATGDDGIQNAISIGFTFRFDNVDYTSFSISTNGWIKLGTVAIGTGSFTNTLSNTAPHKPLLAPLWDDGNRATGSIQYAVTGTSPNRILEVGWNQVNIGGGGATSATALASFKIRIRETSNIIEYVYGPTLNLAGTLSASVGLNGTASFLSVTPGTTSTASSVTANNAISSTAGLVGKKYIFKPPTCFAPTAVTASLITTTTATVSWTAPSVAPATGYEYFLSTTNTAPTAAATATGTTTAGITTVNLTALPHSTPHFIWVRGVCGATDKSAWTAVSTFTTLCQPVTSLPWTENFDALTTGTNIFPPCWSFVNTSSTWSISTAPVANSGANSLRRTFSTDGWAFTPLATLTAGVSYTFSYFVRTNDAIIGYDITVAAGMSQTVAAMTTINSVTGYQGASWTKVSHIFIPTTTGNYSFGLKVVASSPPNGINFDDFRLGVTPTCIEPTALTSTSILSDGATVSWTAPTVAPANGYQYYVSTTNVAPLATTAATGAVAAGNTTAILTNLNPNTVYFVWVRSVCSATDSSSWSQSATFRTACLPTNLPWTENFDTLATGTDIFPPCWSFVNTTSTWSISTAPVANSGANSLRRTFSTDGWAFTPLATLTAGVSYTFSYFVRTNDNIIGYDITVASGTAQASTAMTTINSVTGYQGPAWVKISHVFVPTTTGNYSFGLRVAAPIAPNGINFDDFRLELTPTCIEPTAITVTYLAPTNADISWTASVTTPAEGYEIFYSTTAATPADTATALTGTPAGATAANLSNLTPDTLYYVWVRSVCSGTNKSTWSARALFRTPCTALTPTVTQNFATFVPTCWSLAGAGTVTTGPTGTATGNWLADGFLNAGTTGAIKVNLFSTGTTGWIISPLIDMSAGNYRAKFKYAVTTWNATTANAMGSDDSVQFVASQDGGATWTTLATFDASSNVSNTSNNFEINIPSYTSNATKFAFLANDGTVNDTEDYDFFIDDFVVETISCDSPTAVTNSNVAATTATIGWTSPTTAPANGYEYYYSTINTAPLDATVASGTTAAGVTTANLTGLTAVTTYYVWVRSLCTGSSKSPWTAVASTFTTLAAPCVSPTVTFNRQSNCPTATFSINVDVTNMGSATTLTITDNQSSLAQTVTVAGISTFGPYTNTTNVIITVAGGSTCNVVSSSITQDVCAPANDHCSTATPLTIGTAFATNSHSGSILHATTSAFLNISCVEDISSDVWFSVVVPSTGNLTIETQAATTNSMTDTVVAAFSGSCGALTQVGCNNNNGASNMSLITLTGQVPASTLMIGVWKTGLAMPTANETNFKIAVYDANLSTNNFDSQNFYAYPNPVKDLLKLSYNKELTSIAIYNVLGQEVAFKKISDTQTEIDMSNLVAGTYLVKVTADNQVKTIRVIKE